MSDLFQNAKETNDDNNSYGAKDIEVLEGLEPVRKRPGMYIGGTDERALHHLVSEILDNSMDEAVAGHANRIEITMHADYSLTITDNGRGIPVDEHPKYPGKSALEVILTTLHSGGKFSNKAYETSGGLHGVGISVVNALSSHMRIEVARDKTLYAQEFSRGIPTQKLENLGAVSNRRGTSVTFMPDTEIFGEKARFRPVTLFKMARSKAYLFRGVEIRWECAPSCLEENTNVKEKEIFHFPNGLKDFLEVALKGTETYMHEPFHGFTDLPDNQGRVEYALAWPKSHDGFIHSYCNTIPTPQGGTHESGLRLILTRGFKTYGERTNNKKAAQITADDILVGAAIVLSVFIREPQFQGQTKEKLANAEVSKWVDQALRDHFDHWLSSNPSAANDLLEHIIDRAEERLRRKDNREMARKSATRKLRLPGKLADCSRNASNDTEIFLVEGDSAGGSAKQARMRQTQAVLPLRGKILNVVSATRDKIMANQEIQDLIQALGSGSGNDFDLSKLRYERVIIMTDADVDGAHIASLLVTFFYTQMKPLIEEGHLFLARPPLYRLSASGNTAYAMDDPHKDELMETVFKGKTKVDVARFKGLGEMPAPQLKETTMNPETRTLIRVTLPMAQASSLDDPLDDSDRFVDPDDLVERLMGKNAESRFDFIQQNATLIDALDI